MLQASQNKVKDDLDDEISATQDLDTIRWKSKINESNFKFARQMNDILKKSDRAIAEKRLDRAAELSDKGKRLSKERMKVLRLAEKEGWDTALEYLSDDLAEDETDRKRMRKAKKVAQDRYTRKPSTTYTLQSGVGKKYQDTESRKGGRGNKYRSDNKDFVTCWNCFKTGHKADTCRQPSRSKTYSRY